MTLARPRIVAPFSFAWDWSINDGVLLYVAAREASSTCSFRRIDAIMRTGLLNKKRSAGQRTGNSLCSAALASISVRVCCVANPMNLLQSLAVRWRHARRRVYLWNDFRP